MTQTNFQSIDMDHLAKLARIALAEDEKTRFGAQLGDIVRYFDQLKSVDTDGVEPSAHAFPVYNMLRPDATGPTLNITALRRIAPAFRDNQVVVPRIVDDEG
ncbi:MAG: Asp-tRNA(Asn)/Glu-tRNA(Gln) amidotransferase subunit GatC [Puniceicoccales bacterium]|jgi:aspartyl-tRNA(Asn)/glutamyl-tRNA(Gln) amidotransferase subunit C|nr:Asp-tRNA(Asn)/Glu-tRNA(Gln) amidotransferase subunit GatC [Puniceicoccales bacterium]